MVAMMAAVTAVAVVAMVAMRTMPPAAGRRWRRGWVVGGGHKGYPGGYAHQSGGKSGAVIVMIVAVGTLLVMPLMLIMTATAGGCVRGYGQAADHYCQCEDDG